MAFRDRKGPDRWVVLGLAAYAAAVAAVLLLPVSYSGIVHAIGDGIRTLGLPPFGDGWIEFAANVAMFLPLGALLTLLLRHRWQGVALALAVSAAAELAQLVIPSRQPSLRDVVANVLGAALGAALAWLLVLRRERAAAGAPASPHALGGAGEPVPRRREAGATGEDASH